MFKLIITKFSKLHFVHNTNLNKIFTEIKQTSSQLSQVIIILFFLEKSYMHNLNFSTNLISSI